MPLAICRETGGTERAGHAENEGLSATRQGSKSASELALRATQQAGFILEVCVLACMFEPDRLHRRFRASTVLLSVSCLSSYSLLSLGCLCRAQGLVCCHFLHSKVDLSCSQLHPIIFLPVIQDLDQTGLVSDNDADKWFRATLHHLIAREGSIRGLPAVKAATEHTAAALRAAERTKDAYYEQYNTAAERFSDCLEVVSAAKSREEQAKNALLSKRKDYDLSVAKLQAVQSEVHCAHVKFCEPSGDHM